MTAILQMTEGAAPSTPAANTHILYVATDGLWHTLSDAGDDKTLANTDIELVTANVADEAITNAKLAHMAEATIKGRNDGEGTGDADDLTSAELAAMLEGQFTPFGDADWTEMTLATGFDTADAYPTGHTYAAPGYRLVNGIVYLRGAARCTTAGYYTVATLPTGYRPAADGLYAAAVSNTSDALSTTYVWVYATGEIVTLGVNTNTYHLDNINFMPA
jgi:hypothetical protein